MKNLRDALSRSTTRFRFLILVAVFVAFVSLTSLSGATAPSSLSLTVTNNSSWEIQHLYLSPADNDNWGVDQLSDSSISSGASRTLDVSWDQSTVKIVAEDQDGCFMSTTVSASGSPVWTIASNATRNCGN